MNGTDDWYETTQLADSSVQITEAERFRCFVIEGTARTLLVDTGIGVGDLAEFVRGRWGRPHCVLLTHWHWDHLGGACDFDRVGIHPTERNDDGSVSIDTLSSEFVDSPRRVVTEWAGANPLPDDFDVESYGVRPIEDVIAVAPGETFDLGDRSVETVHLPGHSPGQQGVLDRTEGVLYGADLVHLNGDLLANFEHSDVEAYRDSVVRVRSLKDDGAFETLATAHNGPITDLSLVDSMVDGLESILDGTARSTVVDTRWGPALEFEFDRFSVLTKPTVG